MDEAGATPPPSSPHYSHHSAGSAAGAIHGQVSKQLSANQLNPNMATSSRNSLTVRPTTAGSGSGSGSRKSSVCSDCDSPAGAAPSAGEDFHVSSLTYRDFFPKLLEVLF